tara:strand:+ start:31 stop:450 length:420 start_codon:yes stop_codon:yes gene_type:complete
MEGNKEFITKIKDLSGNDLKEAVREEKRNQIIDLVCRQTDYTREKAEEELKKHKGNYMNVVKAYLNPNYAKEQQNKVSDKSTNQKIYTEIRGFMDKAARNYEKQKQMQEFIEKKREEMMKKQELENKKVEVSEVKEGKD